MYRHAKKNVLTRFWGKKNWKKIQVLELVNNIVNIYIYIYVYNII